MKEGSQGKIKQEILGMIGEDYQEDDIGDKAEISDSDNEKEDSA